MTITNPILRGSHPDPTICCCGDDFYIATSTFEWFPGVQIHHSKDLKNWRLAARPLNRPAQLNMLGNQDSGGIWAPHLSYHAGKFWLIYTDIKVTGGAFRDGHNYLVTCDTIDGEWSDPVFLNSSGFDPSLFHDTDGAQYLVNMIWDHREQNHHFYGIALQQYSHYRDKLVGPRKIIFTGSEHKLTEAPNLYKIGEYYYLLTAEGGTSFGHMATIARSRAIDGPYEIDPAGPLITSRNNPENPIQKAGHASMVQTPGGDWYMVFLMSRPVDGYSSLGRETSICKLEWHDGWPKVVGGNEPTATIECGLTEYPWPPQYPIIDHFDNDKLNINFQNMRVPLTDDIGSLTACPGHLRLYGRESLTSQFTQAHVARRWQSLDFDASCAVAFAPKHFQQMAGMTNYYNTANWTAFYVTRHEEKGRTLEIMTAANFKFTNPLGGQEIAVPDEAEYIHLRVQVRGKTYVYQYSFAENPRADADWREVPIKFETYKLSDEYADAPAAFTGAFVGMFCSDISGMKLPADFDYFSYREN